MAIPFYEHQQGKLRIMRLKPSFQFPLHLHAQPELAFCLTGQMDMVVDTQAFSLRPGDAVLAFPNRPHRYHVPANRPGESATMIFDTSMVAGYAHMLTHMQPASPFVPAAQLHPDVRYAVEALLAEAAQPRQEEAACQALLSLILARLTPHFAWKPHTPALPEDLMHRALTHLSAHFAQPVSLEETADALSVSPFHLSHLFTERLGMGFRAYVNALRLNEAELLLRSSALSITQICYDCGFESQRTFNRVFMKQHGKTPRAYRLEINP